MSSEISRSSPDDFTYKTRVILYKNALFQIVERLFSEGHIAKMKGLSKNIVEEEFFAVIQHLRKINIDTFDYLNKTQNNNTSKDLIDHYVSIYDDLSGNFEKYIRTLVFISKIFEGKRPDYSKIKKDKLANHVSYLKNQPIFKDLVQPFDVTIRNAISHKGSVLIDPLTESITFIDTTKTIKKSYQEFLNETREFAAVWSVVSKIDIAIVLYAAKILESQVNEVNNGSKDL